MEEEMRAPYSQTNVTADINTNGWLLWKLMPGFSYSFATANGMAIRPSAAAGVMFTKVPKLEGTLVIGGPMDPNPPSYSAFTIAERELPTAFAWQLGASASFPILKDVIYINADVNYFNAESKDEVTYLPLNPPGSPPVTIEHKYKFSTINIGASIEFRF